MRILPLEVIGHPGCPLLHRWTIAKGRWGKLMIHHFLPGATDPDCHDHPWAFATLVLQGGYIDLVPCENCGATGKLKAPFVPGCDVYIPDSGCKLCDGTGKTIGDRLNFLSFRRRPALYRHSTSTDGRGAWTIVLTRPQSRDWGFWREGTWWPFKEYERIFGFVMRCEDR